MDSGFAIAGRGKSYSEMTTSRLDYFTPVVFENGVKKSFDLELRPHSNNQDGPFEFSYQPDGRKFVDMSSLTLHGRMGVRVQDGLGKWVVPNKITDLDKWGVINNCYQSLFSTVSIKVGDLEIMDPGAFSYPYHAYLQTLLGTSSSQNKNHIHEPRGFIKDSSVSTPDLAVGSSYKRRRKPFEDSDWSDFVIELHHDLCNLEKYLPPGVKLSFTLRRSADEFVLFNTRDTKDRNFKIVLEDLHLKMKLLEVQDSVLQHHLKQREGKLPLQIKFTRNILKTFAVPKGSFEMTHHNLFFGNNLPNRLYIAFVEQEAYNGSLYKNPFNFEVASMQECSLLVNSSQEPNPPHILEKDRSEKALYFDFLANTGRSSFEIDSVDISFEEYMNGYFILAFDRSPCKDNALYNHLPDSGNITVKVKCREGLKKNYMVLCFASYDEKLQFVEDRVLTQPLYA